MTTTVNIEPWHVALDRYSRRLEDDRAAAAALSSLNGEWERACDATTAALGLLIDTPAESLAAAITKLQIIIRHGHLDGRSDDLADEAVRTAGMADTTLDGAWPLLRVLEDLEGLQPSKSDGGANDLGVLARRLDGWEQAEREALDRANAEETGGLDSVVSSVYLSGLDALLEDVVVRAAEIPARTSADVGHKGRIMQVLTRCSRWGHFELAAAEQDFFASIAEDASSLAADPTNVSEGSVA